MSDDQSPMHDSGERRKFKTGAVRDMARDKSRPDLISPFAARRLGDWLMLGAKKYDLRNWEKGIPLGTCVASLERHLVAYKAGETEEDHLAAIMCNAMFLAHYEHEIKAGRLPASLDDLPRYELQFDALLKVEKPQGGFSMTATHCVSSPGPDVASQQAARAEQLTANVNKDTEVLGDQTNSGWTDDQLDKLVDVLYDIFGFQKHLAITPDIAAQVAEAVDEINWQAGHVDEPKPTWKQYTGECTMSARDLKRLQDAWHEKARLQRRAEMCRAIAEVTTESFRNLGVDRAFPDTDYSILSLFVPKVPVSSELDDLLDEANALDDDPDRAQHETFLTCVKIMCEHVPDDCVFCPDLHHCHPVYEVSIDKATDNKSIATLAVLSRDAPGLNDPHFAARVLPPDHPKTYGIPYWIQPAAIIKARRPRAYLAGPMRGYKMFNWPAFKLATTLWTIRGYDVTSPADMDEDFDNIDPIHNPAVAEGSTSEGLKGMSRTMVNRDIETIRNLDSEQGDCLILLPGWQRSTGARAERALARWLGLTCYDALEGQIVEDEA